MGKGQAAMEFLMTYGWGILVVLIAIGALTYFGILNPSRFLPSSCVLMPGLACVDHIISENSITMIVRNGFGTDITIVSMNVVNEADGSVCNFPVESLPGQEVILYDGGESALGVRQCSNGLLGDKFRGRIDLTYQRSDGLTHSYSGSIIGPVEDIINVVCSPNCIATPTDVDEEDYQPFLWPALVAAADSNPVNIVDEGVVNPDHVVFVFPHLGLADTRPITSSTFYMVHQENLPVGCTIPGAPRNEVFCYNGAGWISLGTYTVSPTYTTYSVSLAPCVSNGYEANNILVKANFDPTDAGSGVCGNMNIDHAYIDILPS